MCVGRAVRLVGRVLLGPSHAVGWEAPGGCLGLACGLSTQALQLPCLVGTEGLWLWPPAQLCREPCDFVLGAGQPELRVARAQPLAPPAFLNPCQSEQDLGWL
jgi:hypothetical protein